MPKQRGRHRKTTPPQVTIVRLLAAGGIAALIGFTVDTAVTTARMFPEVIAPASSVAPSLLTSLSLPPSTPVSLPVTAAPPSMVKDSVAPTTEAAPTTTRAPQQQKPPPVPTLSDQPDPGTAVGSVLDKPLVPQVVDQIAAPVAPPVVAPKVSVVTTAVQNVSHAAVLAAARTLVGSGIPYVFGGKDPLVGLDCSGFVWWALKKAGYDVPYRNSDGLRAWTTPISAGEAALGDLVFWPGHVGIYAGPGIVVDDGTAAGPKQSTIWGSPTYGRIPL